MEVAVISMESIKPSSTYLQHLKPFKLSIFDQLTPSTYSPLILFYPMKDSNFIKRSHQFTNHLKWSLSKTLDFFYPLSGRLQDNLFINDYNEGVPYIETRVDSRLSDFLQHPQMEFLNNLLPCQPFCQQQDPGLAQVAVQVNTFGCGGIAIGMCFLHKINDGTTGSSFIKTWAANARGCCSEIVHPNMIEASSQFPPLELLPQHYVSLVESLWFSKRRYVTRRFVFSADSVAMLRDKARSENVENPTRVQALCAFIWKSAMAASKSISGSSKQSVLTQTVNIRSRLTKPRLSKHSVGNLVWNSVASCNEDMEMHDLVALLKGSIEKVNGEFLKTLSGEKGSAAIFEQLNKQAEIADANPEIFSFASWLGFGDIDFGWGKPIWIGISGEASRTHPCDSNFTVLKDSGRNNAVEAWMTLDEKIVSVMERDPNFLAFACPNPSIC